MFPILSKVFNQLELYTVTYHGKNFSHITLQNPNLGYHAFIHPSMIINKSVILFSFHDIQIPKLMQGKDVISTVRNVVLAQRS